MSRYRFDGEAIREAARREAGLEDFGDDPFREGLEVLLESLECDADLHCLGRIGLHGMVLTQLVNRLNFIEEQKRRPEHFARRLRPPLIILGLPRSGTTFLHRLISRDPDNRGLPFWKLLRPFPGREGDDRKRRAARALEIRRRMQPGLDRKHYIRAESEEECMWLLNLTFVSHTYWVAAPVYGYLEWLSSPRAPRRKAYQEYASLLRYFQSSDQEARLALKAPSHSGSLAELSRALPDAMIVQTHRDPIESVASYLSLVQTLHSAVVRRFDWERFVRANLKSLLYEGGRNLTARGRTEARIFDLPYRELVADPVGSVRKIYAFFGLDFSDAFERRLLDYAASHPKGKYGRHEYRLEDFGLEEKKVAKLFARYRERFMEGV